MTDHEQFGVVLWTTDVTTLCEFLVDIAGMAVDQHIPGYASLRVNGAHIFLHSDEVYRGHPWHDALVREGVARASAPSSAFGWLTWPARTLWRFDAARSRSRRPPTSTARSSAR
jgi:hypothetical protein